MRHLLAWQLKRGVQGCLEASDDTRYSVSAVYTRGESVAKHASIGDSGVESIGYGVGVSAGKGHIDIVCESETVTVWSSDAVCVYSGEVVGNVRIPASAGVYIVRIGSRTAKVIER
ncbi:MAG: hypothetical protein NC204_01060 [Candidatus Amulumruptor caecigallinarius]|nr:hypothetical protein [Candidatus Amulumruptor caecigallinarius]